MANAADPSTGSGLAGEGSWRDRAVERSLRTARAKAELRSDRFISVAVDILSETGRTDFTVQELVERSKASLRSFYQHFSSKDDLLLALFEEVVATSAERWGREVAQLEDPCEALYVLVHKVHGRTGNSVGAGINRALAVYHMQMAESRPADYARVVLPLQDLVLSIVRRGVEAGTFRTDLSPEVLAMLVVATWNTVAQLNTIGASPDGEGPDTDELWQFVLGGLVGACAAPGAGRTAVTGSG